MRNLARRYDRNDFALISKVMSEINPIVDSELTAAGIPIFTSSDPIQGEVPTSQIGRLDGWEFTRAWVYWIARGRMPIKAARAIYSFGSDKIRCGGDCTAPPPDVQVKFIAPDGRVIVGAKDMERLADWHKHYPDAEIWKPTAITKEYVQESKAFPRDDSTAYVTVYHIDTPEALKQFADFVKHLTKVQDQS